MTGNVKFDQKMRSAILGQTLVEVVIVLPILLLLILGAMDFGCMFITKIVLTDAARMATAGTLFIWPSGIDSLPDTGNSTLFPVVTFDSYNVSCAGGKKSEYCPGFALAQKTDPTIPNITPSVEGLFLSNYDSPLDLREEYSVNLGNYQVSLIK